MLWAIPELKEVLFPQYYKNGALYKKAYRMEMG